MKKEKKLPQINPTPKTTLGKSGGDVSLHPDENKRKGKGKGEKEREFVVVVRT